MLKQIRKSIPYFILAMLIAGVATFLEGYVVIKVMSLFDLALDQEMESFRAIASTTIILAIFLVPLTMLLSYAKGLYKKKTLIILKSYYIESVYQKNISAFQKENNAKYISSLTNDFNTLEVNLVDTAYDVGYALASFFVGVWIMSTISPWVLLIAIIVVLLNILLSNQMTKPIAHQIKERSDMFDDYTSYIKEVLSAFQIIKSNNLIAMVKANFNKTSGEVQQKGYVIDRMSTFLFAAQNAMIFINYIIVIIVVGFLMLMGKVTMGGVVLTLQALEKIMVPLSTLGESIPKLFTVKDLIIKIEKTLQNEDDYKETIALSNFNDKIQFQEVDFSYGEGNILNNVNITLKEGGKYLIIGPSGGGKSTLLKLLRKYFPPTAGEIMLDNHPFKDIKKEDYFGLVSNIEQQVFLFEDTLRNNITLYKSYPEEEIQEAIRKSGLTDLMSKLSEGLDTMIYENGKNISGGEKSRVVIARGLLSRASIIFLDEAFASLDMQKAKEIEKNLLALEKITIINVSHVIFEETKVQYDEIFLVKNGQVKKLSA